MNESFVLGETLPEAYHSALHKLHMFGEEVDCPDYNTKQKEVSMTMVVRCATAEPMISKLFTGGFKELEQYRQEVLDGILDFEVEKGKWDYTYHSRMCEQFGFIVKELYRNPESRRAVIDVRDWKKDVLKDSPACLQHIQYFIRDGKLHCKVLFRSNDAVKATFMNAFALIMLQERFAHELGVEVGSYVHRANSFHCYAKDYRTLNRYVQTIKRGYGITYMYKGEWDELMESEREEIAKMVKELRDR